MADFHRFHSRCPVVAVETLKLVRFVSVNGLSKMAAMSFDEEIHWLRESQAQVVFRHGGEVLKEGSTFNDFYGFLTSVTGAVDEAENLCGRYKVDAASSLEIAVLATVTDKPVQPEGTESVFRGHKDWIACPERLWFLHDQAAVEACLAAAPTDRHIPSERLVPLARRDILNAEQIWSSKNPKAGTDVFSSLAELVGIRTAA